MAVSRNKRKARETDTKRTQQNTRKIAVCRRSHKNAKVATLGHRTCVRQGNVKENKSIREHSGT